MLLILMGRVPKGLTVFKEIHKNQQTCFIHALYNAV